jgi:hypothetical protein
MSRQELFPRPNRKGRIETRTQGDQSLKYTIEVKIRRVLRQAMDLPLLPAIQETVTQSGDKLDFKFGWLYVLVGLAGVEIVEF